MQSVGSLYLELGLETGAYNRQLEEAERSAIRCGKAIEEALSRGSGRLNAQTIVPRVDDSALTKLNQHLDLKQRHLRQVVNDFRQNPIRVMVDDSDLKKLG